MSFVAASPARDSDLEYGYGYACTPSKYLSLSTHKTRPTLPGHPHKDIGVFDSSYAVSTFLVSHRNPLISDAGERGALDP